MLLMCIGVVGMLMVLFVVADESEERTLDESASTSDNDEEPFFPRRRENARLNELRSCTYTHITVTHTYTYDPTTRGQTFTTVIIIIIYLFV